MMVAPLAVLGLVLGKKRKRGKWDTFIALLVVCVVVGMSVSACGGGEGTPTIEPIIYPTMTPVPPPPPASRITYQMDKMAYTSTPEMEQSYATPVSVPTPKCAENLPPAPPDVSFYWRGMSSLQLGAYQRDQGTRNDCAIYAIAAALNLLENPAILFDGNAISLEIDELWKKGIVTRLLRWKPNSAVFPSHQKVIIEYLNKKHGLSYTTSPIHVSNKTYAEVDKERMRNVLRDPKRLQLVTIYFRGNSAPELWETDALINSLFDLKKRDSERGVIKDKDGNEQYIFGSGHTMLLVAYDPVNINPIDGEVYAWGFVNSWKNEGDIFWMKDRDLWNFDVVEIQK
jgi:hypothetical protein